MTESSRRARWALLAGSAFLVCALLFGVDRALKAYYYSQTYKYYETGEVYREDENTLLLFSPHRTLFWVIKPNIRLKIEEDPAEYDAYTIGERPGHYAFEVRSNSAGLNSPNVELAKPADVTRIVVLGDSRTMAEGVPFDEIYPRRLERLLREANPGRKFEVINGGVSGYSSHQGRALLEEKLLAYEPDYVTVLFGINDQDRDQKVSDREKADIYDSWLTTLRGLSNRSMLIYSLRRQVDQLRGWAFGKTPVRSVVYDSDDPKRRVSFAEYRENLTAIADLGVAHGFEPIFLIVPTSPYAYYPSLFKWSSSNLHQEDSDLAWRARGAFDDANYELAVELFERLLARSPQTNAARRMLAVSLQHLGRFEDAHSHFVRLNQGIIFARYQEVVGWVAAATKTKVVDLTPEFTELRKGTLYVDDMHPNAAGHEIIAWRLFEELRP